FVQRRAVRAPDHGPALRRRPRAVRRGLVGVGEPLADGGARVRAVRTLTPSITPRSRPGAGAWPAGSRASYGPSRYPVRRGRRAAKSTRRLGSSPRSSTSSLRRIAWFTRNPPGDL